MPIVVLPAVVEPPGPPADLGDYEINPDAYWFELDGIRFGIGEDVTVEDEGFDPGTNDFTLHDTENSQRDGINFGRDLMRPSLWSWQLSTDRNNPNKALASSSKLRRAWSNPNVRLRAGAVSVLKYQIGNRTRRVYGRPRRWAAAPNNRLLSGYLPISCDFQRVDHLHYDNAQQSIHIDTHPDATGGMYFPVRFPIQTVPSGKREGQLVSFGDSPVGLVARINGPVSSPWLAHDRWRLDFDLQLEEGDWIEVSTLPWDTYAIRKSGRSVAGKIGARQRLSRVQIYPGGQEITLGGFGNSGSASATVTWNDGYIDL